MILDQRKKLPQIIDLLCISQKSPENRLTLLPESLPIGGGNLFHQLFDGMVVFDPLPDHLFLLSGDIELFNLAVLAPGKEKGQVLLSPETSAARLSTDSLSNRQCPSDKFFPTDVGFELGTAFPLFSGHLGTIHRGSPFWYIYIIPEIDQCQDPNSQCESAPLKISGPLMGKIRLL
jgi:hypothetical protein